MKKNFVWGALAIASATAIGGSYQIFAQTTGTSPLERGGSKDSKPLPLFREPGVARYTEERKIPPNAAVQQGFPLGSTLQPAMPFASTFPGSGLESSLYRRVMNPNHFETVIIEDGKVKIVSSNEPLDEETRAKSNEARKQLDDAFRIFRSEDASDQNRAKAKSILSSYLTAQFDHDQEMRLKQIKSLEEEVNKLKKQIGKREESKEKLVELRLTLLENDANGLAFPPAFNQIPGANGPGFGPPYNNVHTYTIPNSGQGGVGPAVIGSPSYPVNGYPMIPPAPPAPAATTTNRSR